MRELLREHSGIFLLAALLLVAFFYGSWRQGNSIRSTYQCDGVSMNVPGVLHKKENILQHASADPWYWRVLVYDSEAGSYKTLLLTDKQMEVHDRRFQTQSEEQLHTHWSDGFCRWLNNFLRAVL